MGCRLSVKEDFVVFGDPLLRVHDSLVEVFPWTGEERLQRLVVGVDVNWK
jgi:hypothetical protein